ncbi:splicing factor, arginine/serine-rich 19-like isoform X1 [Oncorhynchus clarkii lewisi]|uniref:splicing factor, arginine/serine-rich 19-like isoform X1 n=1 Tax=Oncorhynchus clarkii lewisi TaxID=490388 RepID=UPI0039B932C3
MDLTQIPCLKGMPDVPPPHGITETAKSPLPSSTSSSSPASPPSSSSSSPGAVATSYNNDIREGSANSMMMGDVVSSTSASLAPPSHSDPSFSSSDPLLCLSPCVGTNGQKELETEIYDPFHPTEGEREEGAAEEEGEKYDPFDPTGSPPSEREEEERETGGGRERGNSVSSKGSDARGKRRKVETGRTGGEEKDNAPPDSTDALSVPPLSPRSLPLPLRRRLDRTKEPRVKVRDRREKANHSDHSEIEEGEIVGATERDGGKREERGREGVLPLVLPISSDSPFLHRGAKPERILRVLDGDSFVSVRAEGDWAGLVMPGREDGEPMDEEEEEEEEELVVVGVGDLRRKLVSRRNARYRSSFPSSLSPQHLPPSPHTIPLAPSPLTAEKDKSRKSSKERERHKRKECKVGEEEQEEERRRKKRKEKDGGRENGGERKERHRERGRRIEKEKKTKVEKERGRSSRSDSRKRKKRRRSTPESSVRPRSQNTSAQQAHGGRSWSNTSEDRHRERDRDRENNRDRYRDRVGERDGDRDKDRKKDDTRRRERDGDSSRIKRERERDGVRKSTSRERGSSKRSKGSVEPRHRERDRHQDRERHRERHQDRERHRERHQDRERDRERRRDGRPVVPPSIQDLNGSDLFAIKRTITVTTTTTTTLPGSPPLAPSSPRSPSQGSEKPHKRKKKSRRRSDEELEDSIGRRGSLSLSPPSHYHGYDSDHFSDKLEIDMHSLDGEALDSDYPSIEDSPPQLLEPAALSAKPKTATKPGRHHFKKKSRTGKKAGQSKSSSSSSVRPKGKELSTSSLSPTQATPGLASAPATLPSAKRGRKIGKEKERGEKGGKKESGRSGRSKKLSGGGRKAKLQSKVSVLVREGVSSTTGGPVGSGKLGMELLGVGGPVGGSGGPVVGGSIAVVFRRDNESRSPFLKPCSEPLLLSGRNKDLGKVGKRSSLAVPPSSLLANPTVAALKSKKAKPSSTTSTSSSASSPSLSLATKRRRRLAKKTRGEKGLASGLTDVDGAIANCSSEGGGWGGSSSDIQSGVGAKPSSPHSGPAGPTPSSSSSSSSSASVLPPSSSPPHTPPPSLTASRDARESSPDSQTVDSSCKTPEPSFLPEDCPAQTQSTLNLSPSSPSSQGGGLSQYGPSNIKPLPLDEDPKSLASPPCSSSVSALASLSLPPSSTDPSSSSSSSVSSSSANKLPPPPPPPPAAPTLPWSLQTGVDCTAGGVLALTALLFKMEEANIASRAKAQEFIHATSQILSQTNQNHSSQHAPSSSSQVPPSPGPTPAQFILHSALPLVGCTKTPPNHLHRGMSLGGGCAQTPPPLPSGFSGGSGDSSDIGWDNESKDPDKYLKKLHTQERAVEEVKLAIKPYYQRKDINKDDYKDILRKAVHKICHSRNGEINPVKVSNLVKLYVQRYKYFRKHGRKMDEEVREDREMDSSY